MPRPYAPCAFRVFRQAALALARARGVPDWNDAATYSIAPSAIYRRGTCHVASTTTRDLKHTIVLLIS
jgi:hypothetical protein